jgi:hypothetical protein
VHELGFTVPGQTINGALPAKKAVEVRATVSALVEREARVETNITIMDPSRRSGASSPGMAKEQHHPSVD